MQNIPFPPSLIKRYQKMVSLIFTILIIFITFPTSYSHVYESYENCSSLVSCGKVHNIGYPFWGLGRANYCGHQFLQLECPTNHSGDYPTVTINPHELGLQPLNGDYDVVIYRVLNIEKTSPNITIQLQELNPQKQYSSCPIFENRTLILELFNYSSSVETISLFHYCDDQKREHGGDHSITCPGSGSSNITYYYLSDSHKDLRKEGYCDLIKVAVLSKELDDPKKGNQNLSNVLNQGFEVDYDKNHSKACFRCEDSGGICGSSNSIGFACFCKDGPFFFSCHESGNSSKLKLIILLVIPGGLITLIAVNVGLCFWMKSKLRLPKLLSRRISRDPTHSDLKISSSFYGIPVFSYSELLKATNNFDSTQELGDGGFGVVYYGKLRDGREVAVKRLYEKNYKRVGQFKNEVEIFSQLHHPNLVTLYGCTSRHSQERLLVYDYIPNGTVADHLYGDQSAFGKLTWTIRMKIAIETASALSYLHSSDIVHRDVKTHNILLDNNFSVKVADFGLSRLFPFDATHVSTVPQGTPGYLDPEYHKCYQVTNKSDVYSFGVVLIELISSLPAIDISRNEDEINLSDYAVKRIRKGELDALVDRKLGFESDFRVQRMTTLVAELAFQCLQQEKEVRPSMEDVFEALKRIESVDYKALESEEKERSIGTSKPTSVAGENDIDREALKNAQSPPSSPNSVIVSWVSRSTSSNPSLASNPSS